MSNTTGGIDWDAMADWAESDDVFTQPAQAPILSVYSTTEIVFSIISTFSCRIRLPRKKDETILLIASANTKIMPKRTSTGFFIIIFFISPFFLLLSYS